MNPSPRLGHQVAALRLARLLQDQLADCLVAPEVDVLLSEVPPLTIRTPPDLVLIRPELLAGDPVRLRASDVLMAVEVVSPGSRRTDRITKRSEYAEAGDPALLGGRAGESSDHLASGPPQGEEYRSREVVRDHAVLPAPPGGTVRIDLTSLVSR